MAFSESDLKENTAVICVDIWEEFYCRYDLIRFLKQDHIKMVILASYSNPVERHRYPNHWYKKRTKTFRQSGEWLVMNSRQEINDLGRNYNRKTKKILYDYTRSSQTLIGINWTWELLYILKNFDLNIKNICFIGGNWDECMIDRPLGWYKVGLNVSKKDYNLISFAPLVNNGQTIASDLLIEKTPNWVKVTKDYYYYDHPNEETKSYWDVQQQEKLGEYKIYAGNFDWGS